MGLGTPREKLALADSPAEGGSAASSSRRPMQVTFKQRNQQSGRRIQWVMTSEKLCTRLERASVEPSIPATHGECDREAPEKGQAHRDWMHLTCGCVSCLLGVAIFSWCESGGSRLHRASCRCRPGADRPAPVLDFNAPHDVN